MRERIQPIPDDRQPSTTRAVAWGALFFSLLSFFFSAGTFFLTYQDGRLVHNLKDLSGALADQYAKVRSADPSPADPPGVDLSAMQPANPVQIGDRIGRVEAMIEDGDSRAKYYLENLSDDLAQLRDQAAGSSKGWLASAAETLEKIRSDLQENAPAAAARLRELGEQLRNSTGQAGEDLSARAARLRDEAADLGEGLRQKGAQARQTVDQLQQTGAQLREAGNMLQNLRKPPLDPTPSVHDPSEADPAEPDPRP